MKRGHEEEQDKTVMKSQKPATEHEEALAGAHAAGKAEKAEKAAADNEIFIKWAISDHTLKLDYETFWNKASKISHLFDATYLCTLNHFIHATCLIVNRKKLSDVYLSHLQVHISEKIDCLGLIRFSVHDIKDTKYNSMYAIIGLPKECFKEDHDMEKKMKTIRGLILFARDDCPVRYISAATMYCKPKVSLLAKYLCD